MENEKYPRGREIIPCCIHLCTKTMYYMPDEMKAGPGYIKVTDTGSYWCAQTQAAYGPDDEVVGPRSCQTGRSCHERPAE